MFRHVLPQTSRRLLAAIAALLGVMAFAAPADAAIVSFSVTDPKGDNKSVGAHDITAAEATYDPATGSFTATLTTAAPFEGANGLIQIIVGTASNGICDYADAESTTRLPNAQIGAVKIPDFPLTPFWGFPSKDVESTAPDFKANGNKLTFATPADTQLKDLPLDCIYAETRYDANDGSGGAIADSVTTLAAKGGTTPPVKGEDTPPATGGDTSPNRPPTKLTTTDPDGDKDGTPDSTDLCPKAPGALANGCPATMPASEIRLGAKRVVVDRLVPLVAAACPTTVTITVTSKGKTLGKAKFTVDQFGSFCRVKGIVKLKKRSPKKVRVVAKATGMGGTAKSVKR